MCRLKSAIILKDRVFIPEYDSHSDMLEELGIEDSRQNAERLFIRAELYPPDEDVFTGVDAWKFNVDQDITPDWYVEEYDRKRMVAAVKEWAKTHIYQDRDGLEIKACKDCYLKNCKDATLRGNSTATLWENSTATLRGNSTATLWENSTATLWENSTGVIPRDFFAGDRKNYILMENSTLKDCTTKTIYQSGAWKLVEVNSEER